jgi:hypothetical protein
MVLGTADAAKWVSRQKNRLPQPRATISTSMAAGRCGRPTAEAAERRLEAGVFAAFQTSDGGSVDFAEWVQPGLAAKSDSYLLMGHSHCESPAGFDGTLQASESSTF